MKFPMTGLRVLLAAVLAAGWGCGEREDRGAASTQLAAAAPIELAAEARQSLLELLDAYEEIRSLLAQDKTEGVAEAAGRLSQLGERAAGSVPEILRERLRKLVMSAAHLKEAGSKDLEHARRAFGEVSRPVVGLLSAVPSLARERFIFQCPMVPGDNYNKWVQTKKEISNPYMGMKMAGCGTPSEWRE